MELSAGEHPLVERLEEVDAQVEVLRLLLRDLRAVVEDYVSGEYSAYSGGESGGRSEDSEPRVALGSQ